MAGTGYTPRDIGWMQSALELASRACELGEVLVGAVLVKGGEVIGEGWNRPISSHDPTAHAEIIALRDAATRLNNYRLPGTCLYVTIEDRIVFGAAEPRAGAVQSQLQLLEVGHFNHRIAWVGGVLAEQCGAMISEFFRVRRSV